MFFILLFFGFWKANPTCFGRVFLGRSCWFVHEFALFGVFCVPDCFWPSLSAQEDLSFTFPGVLSHGDKKALIDQVQPNGTTTDHRCHRLFCIGRICLLNP